MRVASSELGKCQVIAESLHNRSTLRGLIIVATHHFAKSQLLFQRRSSCCCKVSETSTQRGAATDTKACNLRNRAKTRIHSHVSRKNSTAILAKLRNSAPLMPRRRELRPTPVNRGKSKTAHCSRPWESKFVVALAELKSRDYVSIFVYHVGVLNLRT